METPWNKSRSSRLQVQHLRAATEGGNPLPKGAAELLDATDPPTHPMLSMWRGHSLRFTWWTVGLTLQIASQQFCSISLQKVTDTSRHMLKSSKQCRIWWKGHLSQEEDFSFFQRASDVAPSTAEVQSQHQPPEMLCIWSCLHFSDILQWKRHTGLMQEVHRGTNDGTPWLCRFNFQSHASTPTGV